MYQVIQCYYIEEDGSAKEGWLLENTNGNYPFYENKYLHQKNKSSSQTAKQYAYKICKFLNYLEEVLKKSYDVATIEDLNKYLTYLTYGGKIVGKAVRSGATINAYFIVIKGFYQYLYQHNQKIKVELETKTVSVNKESFLYGQKWDEVVNNLELDGYYKKGKKPVDYVKWYSDEEQEVILTNCNTYRDKAIFSISCDGFRIDEILSLQLSGYDSTNGTVELHRSKGKTDDDIGIYPISERSQYYLEEYIFNERDIVEENYYENGKFLSDDLFINLRNRTNDYGKPVGYHNILNIIKGAAKRGGFDPSLIRTHSGRSTMADNLYEKNALNPEEMPESKILEMMRWKSSRSAEPYKNRKNENIMKESRRILDEINSRRKEKKS